MQNQRSCTMRLYQVWPLLILMLAACGVFMSPSGVFGAAPDVVARVNGQPVTQGELKRILNDPLERDRMEKELESQGAGGNTLERLALQTLIHRQLLLQEAGRRKLAVTEDEVDRALAVLRGRFEDLNAFGRWMKARGLDDQSLFESVHAQVMINKVWVALVADIQLSDSEVQAYYADHHPNPVIGDRVRLRIIAVQSEDAAGEILAALRSGESFTRLARQRSKGLRAARGGDTGWVDVDKLPQQLQQAVQDLQVGDVAGPLRKNSDAFLIVGLVGRQPIQAESPEQARPDIERRLLPAKRRKAVQAWLAKQQVKSEIEIYLPSE